MYGTVLIIGLALVLIWLGFDFVRFVYLSKKHAPELRGLKTDAGGVLFIQGGKTYYNMPNGTRRKLAEYPLDLNPGSKDMVALTSIMERARVEAHKEAKAKKADMLAEAGRIARDEAII